jgi:hypothetical protein
MKVDELRELLNNAGVNSGLPKNKNVMAKYLCAVNQNPRCDPEKGIHCKDDQICDASNKPGVCLDLPLPYTNKSDYAEMMWGNHKIIGTQEAIDDLIAKRPPPKTPPPKTPPPKTPPPTTPPPKTPPPKTPPPKTPPPKRPPPKTPPARPTEGTEIVDIEEILRQIQQGTGEEIGELAATQSAVLKCLGLLG